ncbi:spore coat polysaccharide biosynthesis protein SpsF [Pedobacter sp. AK017]|uniref:pseudaminic acid biosynthesis-associated methylase n=1 Tax=Pedobacter sp. AK017 TaxID=2723073 RepID=UPI001614E600|nr:pseudaminic acid biosynthesis-associated methylase [Pedobacter sp. AK017]MBB5439637.1 spore coat polysaccharide biosynthesis protein SpsF [Pedobacter sp. AK017]
MKKFQTEQEEFWAGAFGREYIGRNNSKELLASNLNFFTKALHSANKFETCIEFGANVGMNLRALGLLYPSLKFNAIEINQEACTELATFIGEENCFNGSIFDFNSPVKFDLAIIKGVMIHLNPDMLNNVYDKLYEVSNKYILIAEYYNPSPVSINYRGHEDRLFKRDFAGEMLMKFPDLELIDYGFAYKGDMKFPQDDITWFLLAKK